MHGASIFPLGDGALTITFGNVMDEDINQRVLQLFHCLQNSSLPLIDVVPAYSSLTIYYDVLSLGTGTTSAFERIKELLSPFLIQEHSEQFMTGKSISIPVCYTASFAPDLEGLAKARNLTTAEVIHLHTAATYRVYMIGFLPGFPYMGKVDSRIAMPRKNGPRTSIAAGSVGIAGEQTGIYPLSSPGGWNLIGRTPIRLFDKNRDEPVLLQPGDCVTFYSINEDEFRNHQSRPA